MKNNEQFCSGLRLKLTLIEGFNWFSNFVGEIDSANIFPVADNDTGRNLFLTLNSMSVSLKNCNSRSASLVMDAACVGASSGAVGYSGKIMAGFLQGFSEGINGKHSLSGTDLALCLIQAANRARNSVECIEEGTIVSVATCLAEACLKRSQKEHSLIDIVKTAYESSRRSLLVRKKDFVDAGAKALVYFLEGTLRYNLGQSARLNFKSEKNTVLLPFGRIPLDFNYRTEFILQLKRIDLDFLKTQLNGLGDELDLTIIENAGQNKIKISLKTRIPELVLDTVAQFGKLLYIKVDDGLT